MPTESLFQSHLQRPIVLFNGVLCVVKWWGIHTFDSAGICGGLRTGDQVDTDIFSFLLCFPFLFCIFNTGSGSEVTTDWQPVGGGGSVAGNSPRCILWADSHWVTMVGWWGRGIDGCRVVKTTYIHQVHSYDCLYTLRTSRMLFMFGYRPFHYRGHVFISFASL